MGVASDAARDRWQRERLERAERLIAEVAGPEFIRNIRRELRGAIRDMRAGKELPKTDRERLGYLYSFIDESPYGGNRTRKGQQEMATQDIHAPFDGRHNHNHHDHSHPHSHDNDNDHSHDRDSSANHQHEEQSADRNHPITIDEAGPRRMRTPADTRREQQQITNLSDSAKGVQSHYGR